MNDSLIVYIYDDDNQKTPFPNESEQVIIRDFEYKTQRMGGIPQLSYSFNHRLCLDELWSGNEFVEYNNEKYFFRNTPSSIKTNNDERYSYEGVCYSDRYILSTVFFTDVVTQGGDTQIKGGISFSFNGDITQYAKRLTDSMFINGLKYKVVVNEGITSDSKTLSFEHVYFTDALNKINSEFGLNFYFEGESIYIGDNAYEVEHVFEYGSEDGLLSVNKENADVSVITRIFGNGSSENIPYYYPNATGKGDIGIKAAEGNQGATDADCQVIDQSLFAKMVALGDTIEYNAMGATGISIYMSSPVQAQGEIAFTDETEGIYNQSPTFTDIPMSGVTQVQKFPITGDFVLGNGNIELKWDLSVFGTFKRSPLFIGEPPRPITIIKKIEKISVTLNVKDANGNTVYTFNEEQSVTDNGDYSFSTAFTFNTRHLTTFPKKGKYTIYDSNITVTTSRGGADDDLFSVTLQRLGASGFNFGLNDETINNKLTINGNAEEAYTAEELGLAISSLVYGDTFSQVVLKYITPSQYLMPSIYRDTDGRESSYKALNNTYAIGNGESQYYIFENEYNESRPMDGYQSFEDIRPSIEGMTNAEGQPITRFLDFAYDTRDSDEIDSDTNEYLHPYFFAKLPKTNGDNGFNLFDHANESETMKISFTSGDLAGCTFEIVVGDSTNKNTVQINADGSLQRDEYGNVLCGREDIQSEVVPQDRQNDTENNEVWIALKKDDSSYSYVMPNATRGYKPKTTDSFVILGITLPDAYIKAAEKKLDEALIKYMANNNGERYTFSITFSRVFLAKHPEIVSRINENSRIKVKYNGFTYSLFVSQYSYTAKKNEALPEISVSLTDSLTISGNSLTNAVNDVVRNSMKDIVQGVSQDSSFNIRNILDEAMKRFLSRLEPDTAQGLIKFMGGLNVGDAVDSMLAGRGILADVFGRMQLTNLEVRGSMTVMDLVINEIHAMAGDYSFTDAGAITAVEDLGNGTYRLWLRKDTDYDVTSLDVNDIVYSIINNLKLGGTDYKTSWMRVLAKNTTNNTLTVLPYPDEEVPGGTNYPPQAGYNLTRRGNTTLPETGQTNERAQAWLLSSREGRIMFLANVYKPILEDYNYALTIGKLPDIGPVKRLGVPTGAVGVMTEYLIAEKTLHYDYNGDVVPQMVERGAWSLSVAQSDKPYRNVSTSIPEAGGTTYTLLSRDVVTHVGCRWACLIDKTQLEPKWNSAGWEMIEGDTRYSLTFESSRGSAFFVGGVDTVLTARVNFGRMDITEEVMALSATEVEWARDSGNESMDRSWTPEYAEGNNSIHLTDEDMPIGFGSTVRTLAFICRVFIPVGEETLPVEGRIGISI